MLNELLQQKLDVESLTDSDIKIISDEMCGLKTHTLYLVISNIISIYKHKDLSLPRNIGKIVRNNETSKYFRYLNTNIKILATIHKCYYLDIINSDSYKNNIDIFDISNEPYQPFIDYLITVNKEEYIYLKLTYGNQRLKIQELI